MIRCFLLAVVAASLLHSVVSAQEPTAEPHTFISADGRELRALVIAKSKSSVTILRGNDGRQFDLPLESLSAADQVYVTAWKKPATDRVGDKVLAFARAGMGKRIGKGQCAHLAVEALKEVGAAGRRKDSPKRGDYVWGELVAFVPAGTSAADARVILAKIKGGDVIQLYGARFEGKKTGGGTYYSNANHHTALVEWTDSADGGTLHILHQNVSGVRSVMRGSYKIADFKKGWMRIYRPVKAAPK